MSDVNGPKVWSAWINRLGANPKQNSITFEKWGISNDSETNLRRNLGRKSTKELGERIARSGDQRPFRSEARSCDNTQRAECPKSS